MERWTLKVQRGPTVTKERFGALDDALAALARAVREGGDVRRGPARAFVREIAPVAQVALRAELSGPQRRLARVRAGVDVRGDGSAEPWTGRISRRVVERRPGEDAVDALRRVLRAG